jgi:hypothetical protein
MSKTVYQYRKEIAEHLRRTVDGNMIVVTTPNHPMVMRPLDIVVGGQSGLTAMIIPTVNELRDPSLLHSRVSLNRLAMPPATTFVYLGRAGDDKIATDLPFSATIDLEDQDAIATLTRIASAPSKYRKHEIPIKLLRSAQNRFANTYRIAGNFRLREDEATTPYRGRSPRRPIRDRLPSGLDGAFFDEVPTSGAVTNLLSKGTKRWFQYIDGTIELFDKPAGIAFMTDYPCIPGDPKKVLRASAFAGWVCSPPRPDRSLERIERLILKFSRLQ